MDGCDEGRLAERIAGTRVDGDAEAELCRRFAPRIRAYGLRHLRDGDAADDLVQEVLSTTITSLRAGRLRESAKVASFVLGTCRLSVTNLRRTQARRRERLEAHARDLSAPAEPEPEPRVDDERLAGCLGKLGERARAVVVLTYYGERTGPEIAEELGLSAGNVRVVRHRALSQLLACMRAESGGEP